jgi:RNA polymerase sigma-70 factor (ECF subfamily)
VFAPFKAEAMHDPDAEDVAEAGRGGRAAAARLIARHAPKLLSVARRMLGGQAEAEDAVQDVFLKLWTHAGRWRPGTAKFETWLYRVTLNACYDRLRRRGGEPLEAAVAVPDNAPLPDAGLDDGALALAVEAAVADLPERQRAAILLCHFQERSNIEAAEIMGLSVEALESLLARGRRGLKARLTPLKDFLGE